MSHAALRLAHTDWLQHRLTVTGPAPALAAFRAAAAGSGTIPWRLDLERMEEDMLHLLLAAPDRGISTAGARILAGQLRAAAGRRHALALARVGHSHACPLDLHALLPVPAAVLRLGPDDPAALDWLWTHWGTTQALRQVAAAPRPGDAQTVLRLDFWSADWTPWRALRQVAQRFPQLGFATVPHYG